MNSAALLWLVHHQGYKCALTGQQLRPDNTTVDHIVPLSRGGDHDITNVQLVTTEANKAKGTMLTSEFVALCRAVCATHDGAGPPARFVTQGVPADRKSVV